MSGKRKSQPAKSGTSAKPGVAKPDQMSAELLEFIQAIDEYKRNQQRPFPTWSEILTIVMELGYRKVG